MADTKSENVDSDVRPGNLQISVYICAVCSESSLGAFWTAKDATFLNADNEDSNQTARSSLSGHVRRHVTAHGITKAPDVKRTYQFNNYRV